MNILNVSVLHRSAEPVVSIPLHDVAAPITPRLAARVGPTPRPLGGTVKSLLGVSAR